MIGRRSVLGGVMAWWASGNARSPQGPQAREGTRLDRRVLGVSRAGTGPAPSQNIFIGNLVIVHGSGPTSGVFIYNGAPKKGNPPQIALVPSGVTQDPYGNAITSSKILMQGNVITESGGIFRTAGTSPLIQLDGPHNAVLIYSSGITLALSLAPAATTDGLGNTVLVGISAYGTTGIANLSSGALNLFTPAGITVGGVGVNAASQMNVTPTGGQPVVFSRGAASGLTSALLEVQGLIETAHIATGDTTTYQASGRATQIATSTPITINTVAAAPVTGITFPVASGVTYELDAALFCTNGANPLASAAAVTGPATTFASFEIEGVDTKHGSVATALGGGNQTVMGTLTNYINTGTIPATDTFTVKIRGRFTTSASGTVGISVNTTAPANTYTINNGSYATLMPSA